MKTINRRCFITEASRTGLAIGTLGLWKGCATPKRSLAVDTPESQGVDSQSILNFLDAANACDYEWHSFLMLRHGKVIARGWWDPFKPEYLHTLYSLSKSFTSTAVGFAVDEGRFHLDDRVVSFFPEFVGKTTDRNLPAMTIRHLLTMNTGHETDSFTRIRTQIGEPWIPAFFEHPVEQPPGSRFLYDTGATFMLSAIVQKTTGMPIEDYLKPRLFDPLGIRHYDWIKSPEGVNAGGFGLRLSTESIARFGQTYLQMGRWNGRQVVPESWVREATMRQTPSNPGESEWSNGYGYQFWRCKMQGVYRGDGAYGQYCIILPDQDAVIVATSESWDMGHSMKIIFDHLVPGMTDNPLPANSGAYKRLQSATAGLSLPVPRGTVDPVLSADRLKPVYRLDGNDFRVSEVRFEKKDGRLDFIFRLPGGEERITAGLEQWVTSPLPVNYLFPVFFRTDQPSRIAATATWISPDQLQLNIKMVEGIHGDQITFRFVGQDLEISMINSVALHDPNERNRESRPLLKGRSG